MKTIITAELFGVTAEGRAVTHYTLRRGDMALGVLDYGCTVQRLVVPDREGRPADVVLGYDDIAGYEAGSCWFGAFVGRYANRILGASFSLDGRTYTLPRNDGENHLHGTFEGRIFAAEERDGALLLRYVSPDGEEGYPGALAVTVTVALEENALALEYRAVTDAPTVVNLTNHSYFNLNGQTGGHILDHTLQLNASRFTEAGPGTVPTGRVLPVAGTALDFREEKPIGRDIGAQEEQLILCGGYDHNLILDKDPGALALAGRAWSPASGIEMTFSTTQPAVQLYSGNFVHTDAAPRGKNGLRYPRRGGFCLESQHYPCAPNFPAFPSTVLRPGEEYRERTEYAFALR